MRSKSRIFITLDDRYRLHRQEGYYVRNQIFRPSPDSILYAVHFFADAASCSGCGVDVDIGGCNVGFDANGSVLCLELLWYSYMYDDVHSLGYRSAGYTAVECVAAQCSTVLSSIV